ncbi:CBS domain-containing protein [Streptomyces sp. UNOC14_S4]|uniref:CBS domain-containing protein n=1 Tax=Streptomyces sp. UNOC14_S4 TaxID=2872340 RepID=UPI001E3B7A5A|nr:CBS domain-containing protein [Streptomyces sp. UNOC14_S4]MCC3768256.1 CBS domain-containing protein [Streptomyces sp. UNOC14_S4]
MKHRRIDRIMTRGVVTVPPDASFKTVAETLARYDISGVPVVDAEGAVLGVVSRTDLVLRQSRPEAERPPWYKRWAVDPRRPRPKDRTAARLMSSPVVSVGPRDTVVDAARTMARRHVERLPVLDDDGALVGIVTRSDLLSVFRRPDMDIRSEVIEEVLVGTLCCSPHMVDARVRDGVVNLTGTLERSGEVAVAVGLTRRVDGVVDVVDNLRFRTDDSRTRPADRAMGEVSEEWLRGL